VKTNLAKEVANLLCQPKVREDKEFFWKVEQECEKLGYTISAQQRGIGGTYLSIKQVKGEEL